MLSMRLKRAFGPFPAGVTLQFVPADSVSVRLGDIVLCGLDDELLFPHVVMEDGGLSPFGCIKGENRNIRYRAIAVTSVIGPDFRARQAILSP